MADWIGVDWAWRHLAYRKREEEEEGGEGKHSDYLWKKLIGSFFFVKS